MQWLPAVLLVVLPVLSDTAEVATNFRVVHYPYLTRKMAQDSCLAMGGTLAHIKNEQEADALKALKCSESYWVGLSQDAGKWLWQDGSDTVFEGLWGSAQPDSRGYGGMKLDGELCATFGAWDSQISDSALHDQDCGERHPYICQVANLTASESVTVAAADAGATVVTSADLSLHSALGSCTGGALYRVVHTKLQHEAAAASCAAQGGQLAAFETRAQAAAAAARKCLPTYWVGASDAAAEGDWRWPDGAAFAADSPLALWAPGQPDGGSGAEEQDCAAMGFERARGDRWIRDVACVQRAPLPFICRLPAPAAGGGGVQAGTLNGTGGFVEARGGAPCDDVSADAAPRRRPHASAGAAALAAAAAALLLAARA